MKSLQKVSLLKQERAAVETLQQAVPIERVILFGSKARGDADDCSDFDLLLLIAYMDPPRIARTISCG
jgi:predicted nucleotidyltransferase